MFAVRLVKRVDKSNALLQTAPGISEGSVGAARAIRRQDSKERMITAVFIFVQLSKECRSDDVFKGDLSEFLFIFFVTTSIRFYENVNSCSWKVSKVWQTGRFSMEEME